MVDVCLLGCGGMVPLPKRRLTALLYRYNGALILIDCGEGTQVGIKLAGWGFKSIEAVGFTHYHADHIAGLPGFLLTLGNSGKTTPLTLFGPPGLEAVVRGLCVIVPVLPFDLHIVELPSPIASEFSIGDIGIKSLPVDHHITCLSYSLEIKRAGRFDAVRAQSLGIPRPLWSRLQNGETVELENQRYEPQMVLGPPRKGIKVVYCTDTRPTNEQPAFCSDADLLICEGIYGEDEKLESAVEKKHMVFSEAARLAAAAKAKELWLTHYSPSLKDPNDFLESTRRLFPNTVAGYDLLSKELHFDHEVICGVLM